MGSIFRTEGLSAGYGRKAVLSGAEITAERGRITTLIGPNGCGKSTLLRTAAKQLEPLAGTVFISGKNLRETGANELARKLSILLTERVSPELMTCRDVVESGRYPYTGRLGILSEADREAVDEAMALTSTTELSGVDFAQISDGQRQRVMLARAISQQPELLILDEPTSYLDIRHKLELLNTLKKLVREKNTAVLMSLHELDLALRVSDKIVCIDGGKVGRVGTPEEIFSGGYISALYGISEGCFCESSGCAAGGVRDIRRREQRRSIPQAPAGWDSVCGGDNSRERYRPSGGEGAGGGGNIPPGVQRGFAGGCAARIAAHRGVRRRYLLPRELRRAEPGKLRTAELRPAAREAHR